MYNDLNWIEPPCNVVTEDIPCPICESPMEWQKDRFKFFCCSCEECFDHPADWWARESGAVEYFEQYEREIINAY